MWSRNLRPHRFAPGTRRGTVPNGPPVRSDRSEFAFGLPQRRSSPGSACTCCASPAAIGAYVSASGACIPMPQTLGEAAKAVGKNRTTLLRAVKVGKLSATYDESLGGWLVEPSELHRV